MHAIDSSPDTVAADFVELVHALMKSSQGTLLELTSSYELTLSQLKILMILSESARPLALSEIAEATTLSFPAAGRAVDSLLKHDLVTRREDECDRRVKRVALTELGRTATGRFTDARIAAVRSALVKLSDHERAAFAAAITPLLDDLSRSAKQATAAVR